MMLMPMAVMIMVMMPVVVVSREIRSGKYLALPGKFHEWKMGSKRSLDALGPFLAEGHVALRGRLTSLCRWLADLPLLVLALLVAHQ
jgi:hypothetical protein